MEFSSSRITSDFLFPSFLLYLLIRILQGRISLLPLSFVYSVVYLCGLMDMHFLINIEHYCYLFCDSNSSCLDPWELFQVDSPLLSMHPHPFLFVDLFAFNIPSFSGTQHAFLCPSPEITSPSNLDSFFFENGIKKPRSRL